MIYKALGHLYSPRDIDKMYLWEIAVLLGRGIKVKPKEDVGTPRRPVADPNGFRRRNLELWRQRAAGVQPELRPMDPSMFAVMGKAQG